MSQSKELKSMSNVTKGELAIMALADVLRAFKAKRDGAMTRKQWHDFKNSIISTIEKILEHEY